MGNKKIFYQYPNNYCPFCYTPLNGLTEFTCRSCSKKVKKGDSVNLDDTGIPFCTCGGGRMVIICPNSSCNTIIPPKKIKTLFIAGMRSSGKTTYLFDVLNSKSSETGVLISPEAKKTIEQRSEGALTIKSGGEIEATAENVNDISAVVSLTAINKMGNNRMSMSLTNRAGEESVDLDVLLKRKYINYVDYIVFLIDVLNIPGINNALKEKGVKSVDGETEFTENIVSAQSIVNAIEQAKGKSGKKIPVLIGLSKWDYIEKAEINPPGFSIGCYGEDYSSVYKNGKFDKKQFDKNSEIIRNFLIEHDESEFVTTLETYFRGLFSTNVGYFAFSSYGTTPKIDERGNVERPIHQKRHIMDPFYYIMRDNGVI